MRRTTRVTAYVLTALPISMIGYFLAVNPAYLMTMWDDGTGRILLFVALCPLVPGCAVWPGWVVSSSSFFAGLAGSGWAFS